jgi:hypothetical protein
MRVVIVGEIFYGGGQPDNSLPGGGWGGGGHPDQGLPGGRPDHPWWGGGRPDRPDQGLPGSGAHPGNRPPGSWGGPVDPGWGGGGHPHPGNRPPGSGGGHPDNELPTEPPPGGEDVPEDVYQPAPIPEEIASQYVVSVYNPKTMTWTTKSYAPR